MSPPTKNLPSFFIVPDEKRNYKSSVKLGNVIYQIKQPHVVLFDPNKGAAAALAVADITEPKTLENYSIEKANNKTTKVGLFAKILEFFGFGADVSHESGTDASETYEVKSMTIERLDPTPAFLAGLAAQQSIMDILMDGSDTCAFLITGVVTASGVVFKSTDVKDGANEASLGLNVHGAPLGFTGKRSKKRTLKVAWEDPGPHTVLAYSVQKLKLEDGELMATEDTGGAYFGGDVDGPRKYGVGFDAKLDRRDVKGLQPEGGEDHLAGGEFVLYFPDE